MATFMERFSPETRTKFEGYKEKYRHVLAKAKEVGTTVTETIEVAGTAFAFAWAEGRYGADKTTFFADTNADGSIVEGTGVPASLLVGLAGHVIIFSGMDGGYAEHIRNISDGALAHYAVGAGLKLGQKMKEKADSNPAGDEYDGPPIDKSGRGGGSAQHTADELAAHRRAMDELRKGQKAAA